MNTRSGVYKRPRVWYDGTTNFERDIMDTKVTVTVEKRFLCFRWTRTRRVSVPAEHRLFVYRMDRSGGATLAVYAYDTGQALTLLREAHGYRALENAQLIDIV